MNKIRRGDEVVILCGRDKGRRGIVQRVFPDAFGRPERVIVEGVNLLTHFDRPNPQKNQPGGIVKKEAPLHASNVALAGGDGKPVRVKIRKDEKGKRVRFAPDGKAFKAK
ncbi:MAG: 50S ribosomal protein L24 [Gammaproteobacteria bacterium]